MARHLMFGFNVLSLVAMTGLMQPPAAPATAPADAPAPDAQPTTMDNHPPAGHPMVLKPGADWPKGKAEDVATIDAVIAAYYASTSGKPGEARDWTRFRSLFHPEGRLIPARATGDGGAGAFFLSPDDFVAQNDKYFQKSGFIDTEAARRTEMFGNIAQVWSTYESRRGKDGETPYSRGITSFQMLKDGGRWWILNVVWDYERPDKQLPEKYLSSPKD